MTGSTIISSEQQRIIKSPADISLTVITAAAGSGKTQTLVLRAAALVTEHRVPPQQLLFLTFTRGARVELQSRLTAQRLQRIRVSTLHSLALRAFQQSGQSATLVGNDQLEAIAHQVGRVCLPERYAYGPDQVAEQVMRQVSRLTQSGRTPQTQEDQLIWKQFDDLFEKLQIKEGMHLVTYDQLLARFLTQLQQGGTPGRFTHLFVDEAQDLSPLQYDIIRRLSEGRFLTLVGDPRQAVFGFQGASPELLQTATREASHSYSLSTNYRCPASHIRLAGRLFPETEPIRAEQPYRQVNVELCEGDMAGPLIAAVRRALAELSELSSTARLAILVRSRLEVAEAARLLTRDGLNVQTIGRQREVTDPFTRHWLQPCVNYLVMERRQARHPLLNLQGGLPVSGNERAVLNAAWLARLQPADARPHIHTSAGHLLLAAWAHLSCEAITSSMELAASLRELAFQLDVELGTDRADQLCRVHPELPDLHLALTEQPPMSEQLADTVLITTIHGAKGHEWDGVVLTELQPRLTRSHDPEEFRLRYVALTRSRHLLTAILPSHCHPAYRIALKDDAVSTVNRIATLLQTSTTLWTAADRRFLDQQQVDDPQLTTVLQKIDKQAPANGARPTLSRVPIRWQAT